MYLWYSFHFIDTYWTDHQRWKLNVIRGEKTINSIISTANAMRSSFKNNARSLIRNMYGVLPEVSAFTHLSDSEAREQVKEKVHTLLQDHSFLHEEVSDA